MEMSQSFSNIIDENSNDKYKGLSEIGFGSQENNGFGNDAFDPRWNDQGKGTVRLVGDGLEDPEPRIADHAKLFFTELSTMENTIYDSSASLARVCIL